MSILYSFKIAWVALKTNKVRSFLTILGIVIGIAAVVAMMSLGAGAQHLIVGQIMSMGSNNVFIEPGAFDPKKTSIMEARMEEAEIKTLKISDAQAIINLPEIEEVAPFVIGVEKVIYKDVSKKVTFIGTTPAAHIIEATEVTLGRDFTDAEVKSQARVAVLGYKIAQDLFGNENPIGKIIRIKKTNFRVIGVLEERGTQTFMDLDEFVYVPVTTAQKLLLGIDHLKWIVAKAKSKDVIDEAVEDIRLLLRERHNIYNPKGDLTKDDFKVMSQVEAANILSSVMGVFTLFLSSIAAIALVVGGIGIMNIMLVSVTERTKEIGLRKAVGARKKDILYQFLIEAVVLTSVGGVVGIVLGILGSFFGSLVFGKMLYMQWKFFISLKAIVLGVGVAVVVGLVFGIYPARKASQLSPIEALRYE